MAGVAKGGQGDETLDHAEHLELRGNGNKNGLLVEWSLCHSERPITPHTPVPPFLERQTDLNLRRRWKESYDGNEMGRRRLWGPLYHHGLLVKKSKGGSLGDRVASVPLCGKAIIMRRKAHDL